MKRTVTLLLLAALLLALLSGCGSPEPAGPASPAADPAPAEAEPKTAEAEPTAPAAESTAPASGPTTEAPPAEAWHLAHDADLSALSEVFPGAAEFGSSLTLDAGGDIRWYIGADEAAGTWTRDGGGLVADVVSTLDGEQSQVRLTAGADTLEMEYRGVRLTWTPGSDPSPKGEDGPD